MRFASLLYHDVLAGESPDETGIPGPGAALYKMELDLFRRHLEALEQAGVHPKPESTNGAVILTFDDGGASAHEHIAGLLEAKGWRGRFFVTAGFVGRPGFLTREQVRELHRRGHFIGSHSFSHPARMLALSDEELRDEWKRSVDALAAMTGSAVDSASVPGGMYSKRVAGAASEAGIRLLFTSEPTTTVHEISGCLIAGRFTLWGRSPAEEAVGLATGVGHFRLRQAVKWKSRSLAKRATGRYYVGLRRLLLSRSRGQSA